MVTWQNYDYPVWYGVGPVYSFCDLPEIHAEAPAQYASAMAEIRAREMLLGAGWFRNNARQAYEAWQRKKPWWI